MTEPIPFSQIKLGKAGTGGVFISRHTRKFVVHIKGKEVEMVMPQWLKTILGTEHRKGYQEGRKDMAGAFTMLLDEAND